MRLPFLLGKNERIVKESIVSLCVEDERGVKIHKGHIFLTNQRLVATITQLFQPDSIFASVPFGGLLSVGPCGVGILFLRVPGFEISYASEKGDIVKLLFTPGDLIGGDFRNKKRRAWVSEWVAAVEEAVRD